MLEKKKKKKKKTTGIHVGPVERRGGKRKMRKKKTMFGKDSRGRAEHLF